MLPKLNWWMQSQIKPSVTLAFSSQAKGHQCRGPINPIKYNKLIIHPCMIVILGEFDAPKKLCTLPWMTYRLSFEAISNTSYTNDVGWGCMHRTGQMMLCQSLIYIFSSHPPSAQQASSNKSDIIGWFNDDPQLPFSIHKLALQGAKMGKSVGEWFSPTILCQVLRYFHCLIEKRIGFGIQAASASLHR